MLKDKIIRLLEIILFRSYADFKSESNRYYFSFLWWIIEPILYMSVFVLIYGKIFQRGGTNYQPFLLCGLVSWKWFASTLNQGGMSILNSRGIALQVNVNKIIFPISLLTTNTIRFLFVLCSMFIFFFFIDVAPTNKWLLLPLIIITQFFFINACTCFIASVLPLFPDLKLVIENGLMLLFFLSGIFFDVSTLSGRFTQYLIYNPMAFLIREYRKILIYDQWPSIEGLALLLLLSFILTAFSYMIIKRFDRFYPKLLIG